LKEGFNLIAIPAEIMYKPDLRDWLPALGDSSEIEKVMVYDHNQGRFITLVPGEGSNESFVLQGGEGLVVYATIEKDVAFTSILCTTDDLKPGFNLAGFACQQGSYSAFQLLSDLGSDNVSGVQRYNSETGAFETAGFEADGKLAGIDFLIVPGEGYFVFMK
jgi:hypothetical protein